MFAGSKFKSNTLRIILILVLLAGGLALANGQPATAYSGGYALNFDGLDDAVRVGAPDSGQAMMGPDCKNTKSVTVWVRPLGLSVSVPPQQTVNTVLDADLIVGDGPNWFGIVRGVVGGDDRIWIYNFDTNIDQIGIPYTIGEWVHIALVHAGGQLKAYKNGVLINTIASGQTNISGPAIAGCTTLYFGGQNTGPTPFPRVEGHIDEVSYWGKELSVAEIRQIMNSGLVGNETSLGAYFKMTNGSGTSVTNDASSGAIYNGTFIGTPDWETSGAKAGPDNALDFDGVDDTVDVVNGSAAIANLSAMTLSGWVYPRTANAASPNYEGYFGVRNSTDADFYLAQEGTNIVGVFTNSAATTASLSTPVSANAWQHVALVYDGTNLSLYKNGALADQAAAGGQITDGAQSLYMGKLVDGASQYYLDGQLDEVQVWSRALSLQEIQQNMGQSLAVNESAGVDETNLAAYYRFDQTNFADQTVLYDVTGNDRDGALTNMDAATDWVASGAFNTWVGADSSDWSTAGNWSRNAVPAAGETLGIYNAYLANNPLLGSAASMHNLVVAGGAALTIDSAGSISPSGNLFNFGTITQAQTVNAAPFTFVGQGGYGGVIVDPGSDNLGLVSVQIKDNQECDSDGGTVMRCFNITPAAQPTGPNATLTFYFDEGDLNGNVCAELNVYHFTGSWTLIPLDGSYGTAGRDCSATPYSVRISGVSSLSPFALKAGTGPTAVTLENLRGSSTGFSITLLSAVLFGIAGLGLVLLARRRSTSR